jgi:hypothetical protein
MGMAETRFGRNTPLPFTFAENPPGLSDPNPRVISRDLPGANLCRRPR